jgi:hypothetical protein
MTEAKFGGGMDSEIFWNSAVVLQKLVLQKTW